VREHIEDARGELFNREQIPRDRPSQAAAAGGVSALQRLGDIRDHVAGLPDGPADRDLDVAHGLVNLTFSLQVLVTIPAVLGAQP
jgi:hypothetical protein